MDQNSSHLYKSRFLVSATSTRANLHKGHHYLSIRNVTQWNAMKCSGTQWYAMEFNGTHWNGMVCNGMQWYAMVCNVMQCNVMQCNVLQCSATFAVFVVFVCV